MQAFKTNLLFHCRLNLDTDDEKQWDKKNISIIH